MFRRGLLALLVLGCSASGGNGAPQPSDGGSGGSDQAGTGGLGESGAPTEPTAGTGGSSAGAGGSGGESTAGGAGGGTSAGASGMAGQAGSGGSGGSAPAEPELGSDCTLGEDDCAGMDAEAFVVPICAASDGMAGGEKGRPGHCTWPCNSGPDQPSVECKAQGGQCMPVGTLVSHCVAW